jgi:hypothetical protein
METVTQKKFSINVNQKEFLADYKKWGFSDQTSIVREALDRFMREIRTRERKDSGDPLPPIKESKRSKILPYLIAGRKLFS